MGGRDEGVTHVAFFIIFDEQHLCYHFFHMLLALFRYFMLKLICHFFEGVRRASVGRRLVRQCRHVDVALVQFIFSTIFPLLLSRAIWQEGGSERRLHQVTPFGAEELSDEVHSRTVERPAQHTARSQVHNRQGVLAPDGEPQQELAHQHRANEASVPAAEQVSR